MKNYANKRDFEFHSYVINHVRAKIFFIFLGIIV